QKACRYLQTVLLSASLALTPGLATLCRVNFAPAPAGRPNGPSWRRKTEKDRAPGGLCKRPVVWLHIFLRCFSPAPAGSPTVDGPLRIPHSSVWAAIFYSGCLLSPLP